MKLPARLGKTLPNGAVEVRDADGTWICETWRFNAEPIVAALNASARPEALLLPLIDDETRGRIVYWASQQPKPWNTGHEETLMKWAPLLHQIYNMPRASIPSPLR